jgi:hypothetical protein
MRGFSKRAFAAAAPRPIEPPKPRLSAADAETLRIAKIFSPKPMTVVASNDAPKPRASPDELAMLLNMAGKSFAQGFRCLWMIKRVLAMRIRMRIVRAFHRIMQARFLPWVLAGLGMPGWVLYVMVELAR